MGGEKIRTDLKPISGESLDQYLERVVSIITEFESLSDSHVRWFTHKNPYGCWICELLAFCRQFIESVHDYETAERNLGQEYGMETNENELRDK